MALVPRPHKPERSRWPAWRIAAVATLVIVGCGHVGAPLHPDNPPGAWYVVRQGETMATIATRTGVPLEDLLEINGLRRTDKVDSGRLIYLLDGEARRPSVAPRSSTEPPAPRSVGAKGPIGGKSPGSTAPFRWPLTAPRLTSAFGQRQGRVHEGIDLGAPTGTPILAAADGLVIYAGNGVSGYGNMIVLQHEGDFLTVYAHSSILLAHVGDHVVAGHEICRVGQSGRATAPHLHFEIRRGQVPDDPLHYLPALP